MGFIKWLFGSSKKNDILIDIRSTFLSNPSNLIRPSDIIHDPQIVPSEKGLYAWYFDSIPPGIPKNNYMQLNGWLLLYIGIAGDSPESEQNLRSRINGKHISGSVGNSTLRKSLATLLHKNLNLQLRPVGTQQEKDFALDRPSENRLTEWIIQNARVAFVINKEPRESEDANLRKYGQYLPLNIKKNPNNPFGKKLSLMRKSCCIEAWKTSTS
jgi:hypothetical protein